jgi:N-acetyl-gamma-glutamylphosphate reductase
MEQRVRVAVVGATGYTEAERLRLLREQLRGGLSHVGLFP